MKRNIQTTDCRRLRSRSVGFAIRQQRVSGFAIRMLLPMLMMTVGVMGVWGQDDEKPADLKAGGCSETWLRVIETEALPSITGAKVIVLFEIAK